MVQGGTGTWLGSAIQPKRRGPKPKLSEGQLERLPELLAKGPEAYGFRGKVWTRRRVGSVIQQEFGIAYSDTHVGRLLSKLNARDRVGLVLIAFETGLVD